MHYLSDIFVCCYNAGVYALFPHIPFVISGTESAKYLSPIFLCLYSLWEIFLRLNYYLLYITIKVESIYQFMFLQKIMKFFSLKEKQLWRGLYYVHCFNNIQHYRIFLSNSTSSNLHYTYIVPYKIIQTFCIYNRSYKPSYRSISIIPDRLLKLPAMLSIWVYTCTLFLPYLFIQFEFWKDFFMGTTPYCMRNRRLIHWKQSVKDCNIVIYSKRKKQRS